MSSENSGLNIPELKSIQQLQSLKCSLGPHELKNETKNAARESFLWISCGDENSPMQKEMNKRERGGRKTER